MTSPTVAATVRRHVEHYDNPERRESTSWTPIDLRALDEGEVERPTTGGLLYPGARHQLVGEHEAGKTLAAFALGIETLHAGGSVLHVDYEMFGALTKQRLTEMGVTEDELGRWIHVEPEEAPTAADLAALMALGPTLCIIDAAAGAYDAAGLDDDKRRDVERFSKTLIRPLSKAGVTTIVLDHVTKATTGRGRYGIGSERKATGADVVLAAEIVRLFRRGEQGRMRLRVLKDRFGFLRRPVAAMFELASDPETHAITWVFTEPVEDERDSGEWRPTHLMERVSRHLEGCSEPVSRNEIVRAVNGKRDFVLQAIDHLVADDFASETPGPRGARLVETLKSYRE